jgi:hypothetical protein
MQFTFSVDQFAQLLTSTPVKKPDTKPSADFSKRSRVPAARVHHEDSVMTDNDTSSVKSTSDPISNISAPTPQASSQALHFPTLFNDSFGPSALLYSAPTLTTTMPTTNSVSLDQRLRSLLTRSSSTTTVPATETGLQPSTSFVVPPRLLILPLHIPPMTTSTILLKKRPKSPLLSVQRTSFPFPLRASNTNKMWLCFPLSLPTFPIIHSPNTPFNYPSPPSRAAILVLSNRSV